MQTSPIQSSLGLQCVQSMDLWQKALATLDDDLKASLDFKNSTKRDILEKTLKTAEEKKQIALKRRWKIKIKNKEVVVRDVLEKIIKWLDHFKAIGDIAVQYDQAHAALPWAGVRFLLEVSSYGWFNMSDLNYERSLSAIHMFLALQYQVSRLYLTSSRATQCSNKFIRSEQQWQAPGSNPS